MYRVVVITDQILRDELVIEVLCGDRPVEVAAVFAVPTAMQSPAEQQGSTAGDSEAKGRPLVVADLTGQCGPEGARRMGAHGYVGPEKACAALLRCVLRAAEGALGLSPGKVAELQKAFQLSTQQDGRLKSLKEHERQILQWIAHGETAKQIGARLGIKPQAAQSRIRRLEEKLDVHSEAELAALAALFGLYPAEGYEPPRGGAYSRTLNR